MEEFEEKAEKFEELCSKHEAKIKELEEENSRLKGE